MFSLASMARPGDYLRLSRVEVGGRGADRSGERLSQYFQRKDDIKVSVREVERARLRFDSGEEEGKQILPSKHSINTGNPGRGIFSRVYLCVPVDGRKNCFPFGVCPASAPSLASPT